MNAIAQPLAANNLRINIFQRFQLASVSCEYSNALSHGFEAPIRELLCYSVIDAVLFQLVVEFISCSVIVIRPRS